MIVKLIYHRHKIMDRVEFSIKDRTIDSAQNFSNYTN
jgi:hypothetical protein